jgi:formate dehydrogenase iron-sulfur subunit
MNGSDASEAARGGLEALVSDALNDQSDLSLVERFSAMHDAGEVSKQDAVYKELIPSQLPGDGQQFAFEVNLDKCTGCKSCVVACHKLNGLEEHETWRQTGIILGGDSETPYKQTVTSACHHCAAPTCMEGCPTKAYVKDEVTGIVRHLDDQCIGCKYCTMTCPYDVPQYSKSKGIVRKCDMCFNRLKVGEAPACVQACPNGAIKIAVVDQQELVIRAKRENNAMLPGTPHPAQTKPSTQFVSDRDLPDNITPAGSQRVELDSPHVPLVLMLVLSQVSIGIFLITALMTGLLPRALWAQTCRPFALLGLLTGVAALAASTFHLGRPLYAFRGVLGWRTSWLSREIIAFGGFINLAAAFTALLFYPVLAPWLQLPVPDFIHSRLIAVGLCAATALTGLFGIFCSIMIYHKTNRPTWHIRYSLIRFLLTTVISVLFAATGYLVWVGESAASLSTLILLAACMVLKLAIETWVLRHIEAPDSDTSRTFLRKSAAALIRLKSARFARMAIGAGGVLIPLLAYPLLHQTHFLTCLGLAAVMALGGECVARYLFFTTVAYARMPGEPIP